GEHDGGYPQAADPGPRYRPGRRRLGVAVAGRSASFLMVPSCGHHKRRLSNQYLTCLGPSIPAGAGTGDGMTLQSTTVAAVPGTTRRIRIAIERAEGGPAQQHTFNRAPTVERTVSGGPAGTLSLARA